MKIVKTIRNVCYIKNVTVTLLAEEPEVVAKQTAEEIEKEKQRLRAEYEQAMNELRANYENEQKSKEKLQSDLER